MKLNKIKGRLITEMFSDLSLKDVKITRNEEDALIFTFKDPRLSDILYTITAFKNIKYLFGEYKLYSWKIMLTANDETGVTGAGNFGFVYNKLISCIKYVIDNREVQMLSFAGAEPGMDLVYSKFMHKYLNDNSDPRMKFVQLDDTNWISQQSFKDNNDLSEAIYKALSEFDRENHYEELHIAKENRRLAKRFDGHLGRFFGYGSRLAIKTADFNRQDYERYNYNMCGYGRLLIDQDKFLDTDEHAKIPTYAKQLSVEQLSSKISKDVLIKVLQESIKICDNLNFKSCAKEYQDHLNKLV